MKKLLFTLFLISLIITGCGKKENNEAKTGTAAKMDSAGSLQTVKDDAAPKDVMLAYDLKKDQHLSYRIIAISQQHQSIKADSTINQSLKQTLNYVVDMDVKDIDNDKVMDLKLTIKSISMNAEGNGRKVSYQSGTIKDPNELKNYMEYESLVNNPFSIRLSPKGEILEIYRVDKIVDKMLEIGGKKDSASADQKRQLQLSIAERGLKPIVQQMFRILPDKRVAIDSTWQYSYPSSIPPFQATNINKYKIESFEKLNNDDKIASIGAKLEISSMGKNKISDRGINYDFKNPEADGKGKIYFNMTKGCVQSSKTSLKVTLSFSMNAPKTPRGPMKATQSNVIENTNIVELL